MKIREKIDEILDSIKIELPNSMISLDYYKIIYLLFFLILYISNQHSVEKKIREINQVEKEVEELRTDYITLKNNYMFSKKKTEVLKKIKKLGLQDSKLPPEKILLKE